MTSSDPRTTMKPGELTTQDLLPGESVICRTRVHWFVLFWPVFFSMLLGLPGLLASFAVPARGGSPGGTVILAGVAFVFLVTATAITVLALVGWKSAEAVVTNRRVIMKAGTFRPRTTSVFLYSVESATVRQGIFGRALGYDTIVVQQVGGPAERIRKIPHPAKFCESLQAQLKARR